MMVEGLLIGQLKYDGPAKRAGPFGFSFARLLNVDRISFRHVCGFH